MLDRRLVEDIAARLGSDPGLIEKDWHVTRAIGVLALIDHEGAVPAFGGGTSLSKAWGLIQRFSEDIDFKRVLEYNIPNFGGGLLDASGHIDRVTGHYSRTVAKPRIGPPGPGDDTGECHPAAAKF